MGTQIAVLAAFLVLDRAPQRWWAPVAVGVLLTVAQVNDVQATFSAAAPVAVACGVRACAEVARCRLPPRERWYDASLVVAAVASTWVIRTGESTSGPAVVDGPAGTVTALLPAVVAPDLARARRLVDRRQQGDWLGRAARGRRPCAPA